MKCCPNCGTRLADSAKFCPHCGAPVPDAAVPGENGQPAAAPVPNNTDHARPAPARKRRGIAAQFDAIAAGQKPQTSHLTYFYGFFQLLYHKSFRLFSRTYLPCCLALCIDIGLLAYASTASNETLLGISGVFLLLIAIWLVVVSIWLSRHYPQELYKQVQGDADRIPGNLLMPVLGGVALMVLAVLALVAGLAAGLASDPAPAPDASLTEPAPTEIPAETPAEAEIPVATEPSSAAPDLTDAVPGDDCWLAPADQPWLGAWYAEDAHRLIVFEQSSSYYEYQTELTPDGLYHIYCTDPREGFVSEIYELSADQATLTQMDADWNIIQTYRRPQYSEAYSPLPQDFWGSYSHVEGESYLSGIAGPQEGFLVDAFRFGNNPYQELTDNGDGTYTFYLLIAPESSYITIGLGSYEDAPAFAIYDDAGNATDVYVRVE